MRWSRTVTIVGAHAEGEVGRVVTAGILDVPGVSMYEKMRHLNEQDDSIRRFTLFEPRGSSQMTVNLLLPPTRPDADAGFIPMQPDRCHTMSGSNAMCVTTVLLETGMLPMHEPRTTVRLDTPAGLVTAVAECRDGRCERVSVELVPSFVEHLDHPLEVDGIGVIPVDIAYGGVYFAFVDAARVGVRVRPEQAREMVELAGRIKRAVAAQVRVAHPELPGEDHVDYVLFTEGRGVHGDEYRNGNVIAPGRIDRSPCGTGTAARLAVLHRRGEIQVGGRAEFRSTIDTRFEGEVWSETEVGDRAAIIPRVSGRAWIYGLYQLGVDPADPFPLGYTLADTWGPDLPSLDGVQGAGA
jgi:proline racemase